VRVPVIVQFLGDVPPATGLLAAYLVALEDGQAADCRGRAHERDLDPVPGLVEAGQQRISDRGAAQAMLDDDVHPAVGHSLGGAVDHR